MKTEEVILLLQSRLPVLSPFFSTRISIVSITKVGLTATVKTSLPHGLTPGDLVTVGNVSTPVVIDTFVETLEEIKFQTLTSHDLTFNESAPLDLDQQIRIIGDLGYSRSFRLTKVPNRITFFVDRDGAPALPGEILSLQETSIFGFNGLKEVLSVPAVDEFTFDLSFDLPAPNWTEEAFICARPRISGAVSVEQLIDSYTEQPLDNLWSFVVLGDYQANKDRFNLNDAITTQARQADFRQKIITNFSVYIFIPNKGEILTKTNGRAARDIVEDIRVPLFQSLLGVDLKSQLKAKGAGIVTYAGDGFYLYNGAFYVHEFKFQQVIEITNGDTAIRDLDRAFRDISVIHKNQFDELSVYLADIDLDVDPSFRVN